jgi:SAM-dependent methyltransferase
MEINIKNIEKCPNCESEKRKQLFLADDIETHFPGNFPVYRCNKCGFVYLGIIPSRDEISKYYPQDYGSYNAQFNIFTKIYSKVVGLFLFKGKITYFGIPVLDCDGKKVMLDIGSGSGLLSLMYLKNGWKINGIDFSSYAINKANKLLGGDYVRQDDAANPDFPPRTFDLIVASQVLEHLENPKKVLENWKNLLKDGGTLIIAVPNFNSPVRKLFKSRWYGGLSVPRHFNHFTAGTLTNMVTGQGMNVTKCLRMPFPSFGYSVLLKIGVKYEDLSKSIIALLIKVFFLPFDLAGWLFSEGDGLLIFAQREDGIQG